MCTLCRFWISLPSWTVWWPWAAPLRSTATLHPNCPAPGEYQSLRAGGRSSHSLNGDCALCTSACNSTVVLMIHKLEGNVNKSRVWLIADRRPISLVYKTFSQHWSISALMFQASAAGALLPGVCGQLLPELWLIRQSQSHHWAKLLRQEHLPKAGMRSRSPDEDHYHDTSQSHNFLSVFSDLSERVLCILCM